MNTALHLNWIGPFTFYEYLDNAINADAVWKERWPPEDGAVYLVSQYSWSGQPTDGSNPLYVGSNTGDSQRFCTRIGDLIADVFGFYGRKTGHHSGGQSLWEWCNKKRVEPFKLHLAWAFTECTHCTELALFHRFPKVKTDGIGLLNKNQPPACKKHHGA